MCVSLKHLHSFFRKAFLFLAHKAKLRIIGRVTNDETELIYNYLCISLQIQAPCEV